MSTANPPSQFLRSYLRGAGQVFFMENAITGLFFLAAIFWAGYVEGQPSTAWGGAVGLLVATLTALMIDSDDTAIGQGLFGFNGVLVGVAVPTFLADHPLMWLYLVIGAAASSVVLEAFNNVVTKLWGVAASTGPFVLTTWILMLAAYSFSTVPIAGMGPPKLPMPNLDQAPLILGGMDILLVLLKNISQVFLLDNPVSGILIVIGIFFEDWKAGIAAILGSIVALVFAWLFGASHHAIVNGLYGFSPVLTAIACGVIFLKPGWKTAFFALLATIFTVIIQGALDTLLAPVGIPTFTAPYVLAMWLFTLPKKELAPHPHAPRPDTKLNADS